MSMFIICMTTSITYDYSQAEDVHMCPNGCCLFRDHWLDRTTLQPTKMYASLSKCPMCDASRFQLDGSTPAKLYRHISLIPQLEQVS
jgi:hypothetical protein